MTLPPRGRLQLPPLMPVMDTRDGKVVWGIAGQRQAYRPLVSPLVADSQPRTLARALRELVGHEWLYLADLDALQHDAPDWTLIEQLASDGCRLLVDAGLRDAERARRLLASGAAAVVAALETLPGPAVLQQIVDQVGSAATVFGLDLRGGVVAGNVETWAAPDPLGIARQAVAAGCGGLLVLDVASVGVEEGVPTARLCRQLRAEAIDLPLITGGGVRNLEDVQRLLQDGVDSVLVASALHRGQIGPDEIACLRG